MKSRQATHAGTWYTANKDELNNELESYLIKAQTEENTKPIEGVKAIIAPHAGFTYSGPTAAFAYQSIDITNIKRIFLLGPSHHVYLDGCALSECHLYETPLGNITLDTEVIKKLEKTGKFEYMNKSIDEDEHSLEMHLPFIYKLFKDKIDQVKLVPVLVGSISAEKEKLYGQFFSTFLKQPENLFIISSDFCHWGYRFEYTYYTHKDGDKPIYLHTRSRTTRPIYESIQSLDMEGIHIIEDKDVNRFQAYLDKTDNTICGRHPISILLAALEHTHLNLTCIKYAQSNACTQYSDSSVSYASIIAHS